ncbi:hypothetical protein VTL71DRAFT_11417 [Oculimacula yallundae]|uniref:Rho-GAP domain-containing protein n=1 Tax=Oculimacula yallundae TaxID=86028 RepID=A0ABR4CQG0_9HELO
MLSGLSLSDNISIIALQALPLYVFDISNNQLYQFGEFDERHETVATDHGPSNTDLGGKSGKRSFRSRWGKLSAALSSKDTEIPRVRHTESTVQSKSNYEVFGVDLYKSIIYAKVTISLTDESGKSYIYGYIPLIVAKCGVFLKEKGTEIENIFYKSGSAKKIFQLLTIFEDSPHFGRSFHWSGCTVHDVASILLRYLKTLPQPVIPFDHYEAFISCLTSGSDDAIVYEESLATRIKAFQGSVSNLPPLHRQLLLYLLDLLAVFSAKADVNLMTSARLVAVFQPSLLSKQPHLMTADDHDQAAQAMIFMVENQYNFIIGMQGIADNDDNAAVVTDQATTPVKDVGSSESEASVSGGSLNLPRRRLSYELGNPSVHKVPRPRSA